MSALISTRMSFPYGALMTNIRILSISPTYIWSYIYIYVCHIMHESPVMPSLGDFKKLLMADTVGSPW